MTNYPNNTSKKPELENISKKILSILTYKCQSQIMEKSCKKETMTKSTQQMQRKTITILTNKVNNVFIEQWTTGSNKNNKCLAEETILKMELISVWADYHPTLLILCMNVISKDGQLEISAEGSVFYQEEPSSLSGQELNFMTKSSPNMDGNTITTPCKLN